MHTACCWARAFAAHKTVGHPLLTNRTIFCTPAGLRRHQRLSVLLALHSSFSVASQRRCKSVATSSSAAHMDSNVSDLIKQIHGDSAQAVFYVTGGGMQVTSAFCPVCDHRQTYVRNRQRCLGDQHMQALTWLLTVPGASRTVLESRIPYAQSALQDVLQQGTSSYASVSTADSMAQAAYQQAARLSKFGSTIVGVGCTCALMTDRVKKGDHKACCLWSLQC